VYGDTNSTLAAALAAVKLHLPVAHLEAGLRSFNRRMPEEHNRILTDHAADLLLAPTETAMRHLSDEGLAERSVLVGDVMTDVCLDTARSVDSRDWPGPPDLAGAPYTVATLHRPDNTDDPARLERIVSALSGLARPVLLAAHPRLRASADRHGISLQRGQIRLIDSQPYPQLLALVRSAASVVTDSGGLQKEAFLLRVPCITVRSETEWPETVDLGWNVLCAEPEALAGLDDRPAPEPTDATPYGDGHAAQRVADVLLG
jgi:UDP-N-acetylglucosamine 2-epimerase (non-hydrolysing)